MAKIGSGMAADTVILFQLGAGAWPWTCSAKKASTRCHESAAAAGMVVAPLVASSLDQVSGPVATLAAPGCAPSAVTAAIDWGDGTSSAGTVTGTAPTAATVNSLYGVGGAHTYASRACTRPR